MYRYLFEFIIIIGLVFFVNKSTGAHGNNKYRGYMSRMSFGRGGRGGGSSCFVPETKVRMNDRTTRYISKIKIGDTLFGNNKVTGTMQFSPIGTKLVNLNGIISTHDHHVFSRGKFVRAGEIATPINKNVPLLYDIDTENHQIICVDGCGNNIVYTDFSEIDYDPYIESYELDKINRSV